MNMQSAVSEVKRTGRPVVMHKSGVPLKQVRADAKTAVSNAKQALRDHDRQLKELDKAASVKQKGVDAATKALEKLTAKPLADKAAQRDAVSAAKAALKDSNSEHKAAQKRISDHVKGRTALEKQLAKAEEALTKVG